MESAAQDSPRGPIIQLGRVLRIVDHERYLPEHQERYRGVTYLKLPPVENENHTRELLRESDGHRLLGVFWHLVSIAVATPVRGFFVRSTAHGVEPMSPGRIARLLNLTESAWRFDEGRLTEAGQLATVAIDVNVDSLRKIKSPAGVAVRSLADDMPLFSGAPPDRTAVRPYQEVPPSNRIPEDGREIHVERASVVNSCEMPGNAGDGPGTPIAGARADARDAMGEGALVMVLAQRMPGFAELMRKADAGTLDQEAARQFKRDRAMLRDIARRWIRGGVLSHRLDRFGELAEVAAARGGRPMAYLLGSVRNEWPEG